MIEWLRAVDSTRAIGIERREDRHANGIANLQRFGVDDRAQILLGDVPDLIDGLEAPHAIFIGGGLSSGVLDRCAETLRPGGRFVAHGVTMEAEEDLVKAHRLLGGEMTRISIENSDLIGRFRGWKPLRTVTCWAWTKDR